MKTESLLFLLFLSAGSLYGQKSVNCDSVYTYFENSFKKIGRIVYDEPPVPIPNQRELYIPNTDSLDAGTIFVRVIVDTQGKVVCAKVVRSDQELLDAHAIQIAQGIMFTSATTKGNPVTSVVVLPIKYGVKKNGLK